MPTPPPDFVLSPINTIPADPMLKVKRQGNLSAVPPRRGRLKGEINKISRDIKNGVITAAENLGRDGKGAGGFVGYLEYVGLYHPKAFCHLIGKLLPYQINAEVSGHRISTINIISVPHDTYLSGEDAEKMRAPGLVAIEHDHTLEAPAPLPEPIVEELPQTPAEERMFAELKSLSREDLLRRAKQAGLVDADEG